jgi:transglutaminase-like putative cysteine protease
VLLLAAGSIGLVAIVVDFLAVRLHRPAIAGLPLLVVYMAPIATTAKVGGLDGAISFLLAAIGYLMLLSSDGRHRLRGWGRVVTVWHYSGEDERLGGADIGGLAATGRRIGMAAVCAALIAPLLVPGLTLHHVFGGHAGGGGHHIPVGLPNPVAQLHGLLARSAAGPVLTYHTDAADAENYLQVYVLNYDATLGDWELIHPTAGDAVGTKALLPAPGLAAATPRLTVRTSVTIPRVAGYSWPIHFLPAPYWPMRVQVAGTWHEAAGTLMIYSGDSISTPLHYTVTSGEVQPTPEVLAAAQHVPAAIAHTYLGFKSPVTRQLTTIADQVTHGQTTAFGKAVALERWFLSKRFSYSVQASLPNTPQGLLSFLTTDRQGFCQQFAFAMAVLARTLGIPSRVAIGFTAGQERQNATWVVTTADAHAWPELYFSGVGWLRFEPTPSGIGGQETAVEPSYVSAIGSGGGTSKNHPGHGGGPSPTSSASPGTNIGAHVRQAGTDSGAPGASTRSRGSSAPVGWIVLAVLIVAAVAPGMARLVTRRRRWHAASGDAGLAQAAWQELCAVLEDFGLGCRLSESPRAAAKRVGSVTGLEEPARQAIGRIASVVEQARYAPVPADASTVRTDVRLVHRALTRNASTSVRWRARLLPASTLRPTRASIRQAAGLITGWTPAAGEG